MRSAAELKSREEVATTTKLNSFNFKEYMMTRAQLVNAALDKAVPLQYPEEVTEAMRYMPGSQHSRHCFAGKYHSIDWRTCSPVHSVTAGIRF